MWAWDEREAKDRPGYKTWNEPDRVVWITGKGVQGMREWIEQAQRGDADAWGEIVRRFGGMAQAVAYELLRDPYLAEDAVQEAFVEAYKEIGKLHEPEAFPGWFKRIVQRKCYRLLRRKKHGTVPLDETGELVSPDRSPAELAIRKEQMSRLYETTAALSAPLRIAVNLFYFHGLSLHEVSEQLNTPVPTLKKRLFDARRRLKRSLLPVTDITTVFHELYEGGRGMLHLVNGDHAADQLREAGIPGEIFVWREVYPFGPVYPDLTDQDLRMIRAWYLQERLGVPASEYLRYSEEQDRLLAKLSSYEEVVLWFEHDLFDQTMLCQLLDRLSRLDLGKAKLSLLCIGEYPGIEHFRGLGQLSGPQLATLSGTWQAVSGEELRLGSRLWQAYAAAEPGPLQSLLDENTSALPYAREAFLAHLAQYPSLTNGLGAVEQAVLEWVRDGVSDPRELFQLVCEQYPLLGMGDLAFRDLLTALSAGPQPLLTFTGRPPAAAYAQQEGTDPWGEGAAALTELGQEVLAGRSDRVAECGIDAWFGGVQLQGRTVAWRWDVDRGRLSGPVRG
ncbi:sigma-70 family RNA polymerase sigma factor [Gorillibacterium timonense]|uniref:sigma-70 family RNA polymerase sigma factor n=1 Tax=Gorillibacterium timonense TaxID=1689269 RepID=UPI000AC45905|nr:sigma-70 family RNA polymerase sigma factor [Gorillibacterium timonense]